MHNKGLVLEILSQVHDATKRVMKRFEPIQIGRRKSYTL